MNIVYYKIYKLYKYKMSQNLKTLLADNHTLISEIISLLSNIDNKVYNKKSNFLINHTIGQHFRHIYDFYFQFLDGLCSKNIYYENRIRDNRLESDCNSIIVSFQSIKKKLVLEENFDLVVHYQLDNKLNSKVTSNIIRELVFIYSHALHHLAMIRGVLEVDHSFVFSNTFGFSLSTIKHKKVSI